MHAMDIGDCRISLTTRRDELRNGNDDKNSSEFLKNASTNDFLVARLFLFSYTSDTLAGKTTEPNRLNEPSQVLRIHDRRTLYIHLYVFIMYISIYLCIRIICGDNVTLLSYVYLSINVWYIDQYIHIYLYTHIIPGTRLCTYYCYIIIIIIILSH